MTSLEYPPILIGQGIGVVVADRDGGVRKDREYVSGAVGHHGVDIPQALGASFDELTRRYGAKVYESMLNDPVVYASFDLLKLGVISTGLSIQPAVSPKPGEDLASNPDAVLAAELAEFCVRAVSGLDRPIDEIAYELLDALAYGNKLAELTCELASMGVDRGKLLPKRLKPKPRESVDYVVSSDGEVVAIQAKSAVNGAEILLPVEKFVRFTWGSTNGDPRGSSVLRCIADAWNLKVQTWPELYAVLQRFGSPSLIGTTAEGEEARLPEDDDGLPIEGESPISPQAYLAQQMLKFRNGTALAVPFGTKIEALDPKTDGSAFRAAIEMLDRQIVLGVLHNTRTMLESQHGSKADSETGENVTGVVTRFIQKCLSAALRKQLFERLVEWNFGPEAKPLTPLISFGETERQDFAADAGAVGRLTQAGYLAESQLPGLDARLGIPVRKPGEARIKSSTPQPTDDQPETDELDADDSAPETDDEDDAS